MEAQGNGNRAGDAMEALEWLIAMGADETIGDSPVNWFERSAKAAAPRAALPKPVPAKPGSSAPATPSLPPAQHETLQALLEGFKATDVQGLGKSAQSFCFVEPVAGARVLVMGDRPRTDEENEGKVFAGKVQTLLRAMLKSIGLSYPGDHEGEQVAIANLVPWRPPGNRTPTDIEANMCAPFMRRALELLQPRLILALSALPAKALAGGGASVAQQRGKWLTVQAGSLAIPLRATFHPAELLAYPERKRQAWADLLELKARLEKLGSP